MTEGQPTNQELQVVSREQVRTDFGVVVRSDILFKGNPRTVYTSGILTEVGFVRDVEDIESAERAAERPNVIRNLASKGKTPEQFIEEGSHQFVANLRPYRYLTEIQESVLTPLIKQRAMGRLFAEAKRAQANP